ncbi:putative potassium transporter 12 isoform X2 [Selaginella moellendorffii]|uniref:putative potassium transporter 12 isoform X2 n=1 Tax=Selaginella moellendorffii TaxID=88036 RepID=UPI000D1C684F|nr:putative potassium transporter 12 isoform X2 [Selaginella moellendorffii]|eukprot:XP_024544122.1 putative potassium transporter 12 isoform X2 [Selaginella moellendorffii]
MVGSGSPEIQSAGISSSDDDEDSTAGVDYLRRRLKRLISRHDSLEEEAAYFPWMHSHNQSSSGLLLFKLAFQSIGVVYGDLGTSPLYVFSSTFTGGHIPNPEKDIVGALSLILYTLLLIPLCKYVLVVLRANDNGEGGTFALYSLISRYAKISVVHPTDRQLSTYKLQVPSKELERALWIKEKLENSGLLKNLLLLITLIGTCMIIGDGTLTPAISDVVVIVSIVVLVILFSLQRFGTSKVAFLFAPALLLWFLTIGVIGLYNLSRGDMRVFQALNPWHIYLYFKRNGKVAWISLGGIVLCITGTEAMFADLGHFSVKSIQVSGHGMAFSGMYSESLSVYCIFQFILKPELSCLLFVQIAFTTVVLPCLLLAYGGQASYLIRNPEHVGEAFYKSIPGPIFWPVFVIATMAAVIASQAMISASFSVMKMAESMGCFPRVHILHTSKRFPGQIYIPEINWLIMILTVALTAGFKDTTQLGNAYGIAVVATMCVTTSLVTLIMLMIWQINVLVALGFFLLFGTIELAYLSSVLFKVTEGGWVPLVLAAGLLFVMYIWHYGTKMKHKYEVRHKLPMDWISQLGSNLGTVRVAGLGLVYNELVHGVPGIFHRFITYLPAIHSVLVFVCIRYVPVATVPRDERIVVRRIGPKSYHMYRCIVRYGYRDMRTETAWLFEQLLVECLENFIRREAREEALERAENAAAAANNESLCTPLLLRRVESGEFEEDLMVADNDEEAGSSVSEDDSLALLRKCRETGIVYLLGHGDVRARKDSFFLKKLVINYFYAFLRRNCKQRAETLNIPPGQLLRIGMTYFV